jgi:aspartate carbamoyltransferase
MVELYDILSCKDFDKEELLYVLKKASEMECMVSKKGKLNLLEGKIVTMAFFEPSTRTRLSFETAAHRMGADVVGFSSAESTSVKKGESFEDTIKTIDQYSDTIVIRRADAGSAKRAAEVASAPVINAGDGSNEHPTQAMLDLYTIMKEKGTIDGLTIGLIGDLKHARVMHSLAYALSNFNVKLYLLSPDFLKQPPEVIDHLNTRNARFEEVSALNDEIIKDLDVLYTVRVQRERSEEDYLKARGSYIITPNLLKKARNDLIVLHPLPRREELPPEMDDTPYARYFEQARNGIYARMALLGVVARVL